MPRMGMWRYSVIQSYPWHSSWGDRSRKKPVHFTFTKNTF